MFKNLKKLWKLLPKDHRYGLSFIIFLILISSLLEVFGIGLIFPLLSLLSGNSLLDNYPLLNYFIDKAGNPSQKTLIIYGFLLINFVYLCKFLFLIFAYLMQSKYLHDIKYFLSKKLFSSYLNSNYEFHITGNSAIFIRNISLESSNLLTNVLSPLIIILTESILVIGITFFLLYHEPLGGSVLILYIIISIYFFQNLTKSKIKKISQSRLENDGLRYKSIVESLNGIKEIKLLGKENNFTNKFKYYAKKSFNAEQKIFFLSQMPRIWLEFVCILGLTLLIILLIFQTDSIDRIIPTVGIFGFAAFRVLPLSNRILNSIQQIRYGKISLDTYINELNLTQNTTKLQTSQKPISFSKNIKLKNIYYSYPESNVNVLRNIDFTIKKGDFVGIIGKSGIGKTTLVDVILGLLYPTSGTLSIDNKLIDPKSKNWSSLFGYVQQDNYLIDDSLKNNVALGVNEDKINIQDLLFAIRSANLESFVESLPNKINTNVGEKGIKISGGQRQRIAIARALYFKPSILVLDEATSALDSKTEDEVMEAIDSLKGKCTIIMISHRPTTLSKCNIIYELKNTGLYKV